jgi:lysophospholipase L1-like esterase
MADARRERWRRRRRALLAFSASSLVSLTGAELWCRHEFGTPMREKLPILAVVADARRGYAMVPHTEHYTYEQPVRVNGLGLRGPEIPEKGTGETRILCLGDSTTYGQGLAEDTTLPALLEQELSRSLPQGRTVRVVNAGLRGYGTEQELALLEEIGPRVRADVVVLFWYPNDLEKPEIEEIHGRLLDRGAVEYDTLAHLEGRELVRWRVRERLRRSALLMQTHDVWASLTAKRMSPSEVDRGFERLDRTLGEFERVARSQGARLVVAAIPTAGMAAAGEAGRAIPARVGDLARQRGLPFVDLFDAIAVLHERTGRLPLLPYDWHYTPVANLAMAERTAAFLRALWPDAF